MSKQIKTICITGIGIALFVVFTLCLQVPVFENYYLCLGYFVMAVWLNSVGITSGTIVGAAGVALYCVLSGGLRGMPGWALGNILIGILLGSAMRAVRKCTSRTVRAGLLCFVIIASCALGILGVKSITESLLYTQPFIARVLKNTYAFIADAVVLIFALPVCAVTENRLNKLQWKE